MLKPPIFLAIDLDEKSMVLELAKSVSTYVGGFKVGPRLCMKYGASLVSELSRLGRVFVDNKYFDIPSTMEASIRATFEAGASFTTIHGACGPVALRRLADVERELNEKREFKILAVTVLTSFDAKNLSVNASSEPIAHQVENLAREVVESGLGGLVCSAEEVQSLRNQFPDSFLVVPGIRFPSEEKGDQARVFTPSEAMEAGASALVVGRPIYRALDPVSAAQKFFQAVTKN